MFKFAQKCVATALVRCRNSVPYGLNQVRLLSSPVLPIYTDKSKTRFRTGGSFETTNAFTKKNEFKDSLGGETEQEFVVRIKNDPDTFGGPVEDDIVEAGDVQEEKHYTEQVAPRNKLSTKQYADLIKGFIRNRKIKEAIDVLEVKMLKEDKVKPEGYIYNLLLGACGRVGYTKKAFMLYNQMKRRDIQATGGTYTALFNACANSPWPDTDGLSRAKQLHEIMIEKGFEPNDTNYNAMIKAFGRCKDLPMAFTLVDEMISKRFNIKNDTINFLLQACISDKDAGFRHSLLVWRKAIGRHIMPNVYTFNLLLRCVRDCGLGDLEATRDVIERITGEKVGEGEQHMLGEGTSDKTSLENCTQVDGDGDKKDVGTSLSGPVEIVDCRPNLLAKEPHLGSILSLSEVTKPEDRLILLGGCNGFLNTMVSYKCTPDIKTFTLLLDSIPSTNAAEKELIVSMKKLNVKPDIDFYNMLIKKKSMRFDYEGAKEVLSSMKQMKYRPNLITYGVLALGCKTKNEALELVNEMQSAGYRLNSAILGAMLHQACHHYMFDYIFEIMELCLKESIPVNKMFLQHLEEFKRKCKDKLEKKDFSKSTEKMFGILKARLKTWLTEIQIDDTEDAHPWQQHRQHYPENIKFKAKDSVRFKPRRASLFKVKTSTKQRY